MKIIIDNSNLFAGGGIQVATSFINDLKELPNENIYHIVQSINSAKAIDKALFPENFIFYDIEETSKIKKIKKVKEIENKVQPNCIFVTFGPSYHKSNFPKIVGFAIPYIVYPDSPFLKKISLFEKIKYKILEIIKKKMFIKNSDALIFETHNAKDIFNKKKHHQVPLFTVNNTLNSIFHRLEEWKHILLKKTNLDIFCLTANYPHKNIDIIPKVIDELLILDDNLNFKFHISLTKEELNFGEKYDNYINYLGRIEHNKLPNVYQQMDILFMPSLLEVFSTTYLEAMFMKVPIVASDMGFARDICAESALFCEPLNAKDYAQNILAIYKSPDLKQKLIDKGTENLKRFGTSMDRTKKYLEIIESYV